MLAARGVALLNSRFVDMVTASRHARRDSSDMTFDAMESDITHDHFEAAVGCALQKMRDGPSAQRCLERKVRAVLDRSLESAPPQLPGETIGLGEREARPIVEEGSGLLIGVEVGAAGSSDRGAEYAAFPGAIHSRDYDNSASSTRHALCSTIATFGSTCWRAA